MSEPTREVVDQRPGLVVLEFGADWCPHCQAIQSAMRTAQAENPQVQHIPIEDGKGKPLGRSFQVRLWPTLVFLREGQVVTRLVRPSQEEITTAFSELTATG